MKKYVAEFIGTFWLAPIAGGVLGALIYNFIGSEDEFWVLISGFLHMMRFVPKRESLPCPG